jgi:beta-glucosidase
MKKIFRILAYLLIALIIILIINFTIKDLRMSKASERNLSLLGNEAPIIIQDNRSYRDLNKNGRLDLYEDSNKTPLERAEDLLGQMTLAEKAGSMFITTIGMTPKGRPMETPVLTSDPMESMMAAMLPTNSELIVIKKLNSFSIFGKGKASIIAKYNNAIQKLAERTRLGIPITLASDPRHGHENNPVTAIYTPSFSQWPGFLGLAATRDTLLVRKFGDIARQEYLACGIRLALHPMADLTTEPRWGQASGTFGEDAKVAAEMVRAYVLGFQGDSLGRQSVACMTKHFPGSGTNTDGHQAAFPYGKKQSYAGNNFPYHLLPFIEGGLKAHTAQIMTSYAIITGQTNEDVAVAFNRELVTELLRDSLGFEGVICTDWNVIQETEWSKRLKGGPSAWGMENLTAKERVKTAIEAGIDQFGGEQCPEIIVELVTEGSVSSNRIDQSVRRILLDKFRLGLFDNPYVDEENAETFTGRDDFRKMGEEAQAKSTVLLKNNAILPLQKGTRVYWEGIGKLDLDDIQLVGRLEDADVVVKRIESPHEAKSDYILESFMRLGRLYFTQEEKAEIIDIANKKPTIIVINLDRPAIFPEINGVAQAVLAEFGISNEVLGEILTGKKNPTGKLPFELPSSWEAVENQLEDVPYDSDNPLYLFGHGLSY